jgi:hypothetical protein
VLEIRIRTFFAGSGNFDRIPDPTPLKVLIIISSVAEPHHFYAAPAPGENFDAAPAPAPILLYSKAKFLKQTQVYTHVETILFI